MTVIELMLVLALVRWSFSTPQRFLKASWLSLLSTYMGNSLIEPSTKVCVAERVMFTPSVVIVEG